MTRVFFLIVLVALSGCSSTRPGGYYKDDGPHERPPANLEQVADAMPRSEPLHKFANRPYEALGKRYHGQKTSSGETYDMYAMTAAHPTLPIPSYVRVTNVANRKSVVVRINDRGPFKSERVIDLSYVAAYKLGFIQSGQARVEVEAIVR